MACSLYNNNGYGCGGCVHFVKTVSVTVQVYKSSSEVNPIKTSAVSTDDS